MIETLLDDDELLCFDSILVRLKAKSLTVITLLPTQFQFHTGSIKSVSMLNNDIPKIPRFQFHTGSIKRLNKTPVTIHTWIQFQFHTGSIKSTTPENAPPAPTTFQFHTGSIKRCTWSSSATEKSRFNSILVRLKGFGRQLNPTSLTKVSIPYWFD